MTMHHMDGKSGAIADKLMGPQDGITEQQREFRIGVIEPRLEFAAQLAVWDSQQPHINRGEE